MKTQFPLYKCLPLLTTGPRERVQPGWQILRCHSQACEWNHVQNQRMLWSWEEMWHWWKPEWNIDWSSDWNIHHITVNATENKNWSPKSHRIILLSWKTSGTRRHAWFSKREATSGIMKISLKLWGLDWRKVYSIGIFQITTSKKLFSKYWCAFICMYTHLKDPSLQMKARTRKLLVKKQTLLPRVRDNSTSNSHCARQHL